MHDLTNEVKRLPTGFHLLLSGQTLSLTGTQITTLALPLTAIHLNHANSFETGILFACGRVPYLLLGLFVGLLVDNVSHRLLLIAANTVIALVLSTIPLAVFWSGHISMFHLYAAATLVGAAMVITDITFLSWVPAIVPHTLWVKAQSRLELAQSAAMIVGLPLAGWLIATFSAPIAIVANVVALLLMTALLPYVRVGSPSGTSLTHPATHHTQRATSSGTLRRILTGAVEGARFLLHTPPLRAATFATATLIFFYSAYSALFIIYLSEGLQLTPEKIGIVTSFAAVGSVTGALFAGIAARWLGLGRVLVIAIIISAVGAMLCPLLQGEIAVGVSQSIMWFGMQIYNIHQVPLRYTLSPAAIHGRINASIRTLVWGLAPLGAVLGGACGTFLGIRLSLLLAAILMTLAATWIVLSPLWKVRTPQLMQKPG